MNKGIILAGVLILAGCTTSDGPVRKIVRDQEFLSYTDELETVERQYLRKEITYAEYMEKKSQIEGDYQGTIDTRMDQLETGPNGY